MTQQIIDELDELQVQITNQNVLCKSLKKSLNFVSSVQHIQKITFKEGSHPDQVAQRWMAEEAALAEMIARKVALHHELGHASAENISVTSAINPITPPILAEILTRLVTKPKLRERVLGSRAEQFQAHVRNYGVRRAHIFYWTDTVASTWPAVKQLTRWAIVGDIFRRFIGS